MLGGIAAAVCAVLLVVAVLSLAWFLTVDDDCDDCDCDDSNDDEW